LAELIELIELAECHLRKLKLITEQWIEFIGEVEVTEMIELAESTMSTGVGR
jgi:hypothetical protein